MDDDLKTLLEENLRLAKDNNRMLRAIRRSAVVGVIGRILFWVIVLGVPAYIYVTYFSPIVSSVISHSAQAGQNPLRYLFGLQSYDTFQRVLHTVASSTRLLP